jgi:hypothetical protein
MRCDAMGLGRTTGDGWKLESLARWWMVERRRRRRRRCGSDVDALASQLPSLLSAALPAVLENVPRRLEPGRWNMPTRRGRRCHRGLLPHGVIPPVSVAGACVPLRCHAWPSARTAPFLFVASACSASVRFATASVRWIDGDDELATRAKRT